MAEQKSLKISYCTTCKGRLHHLMQTLRKNMDAEEGNPNVEFVVLDYGDDKGAELPDGTHISMGDWIKKTFPEELNPGPNGEPPRLIYARYESKYFKMAHAKNMAHRLATGDVLCNVDADFYIAPKFSKWLAASFDENFNRIVSCYSVTFAEGIRHKLNRLCGVKLVAGGSGGCIAITRHNFENLGGYDEGAFGAWGGGDLNLILRSMKAGLERIKLSSPYLGESINHGNQERVEYFSDANKKISEERLSRGRLVKNIVY